MQNVTFPAWRDRAATLAAAAAVCAVPLSIAVSESLLAIALAARGLAVVRHPRDFRMPRVFWFWLAWAGLEIIVWLRSPQPGAGAGEMRHLALIAALFAILPALKQVQHQLRVWQGLFVTGTVGSVVLIFDVMARVLRYRHELSIGGDPGYYLRTGGLLHHWMIYATVEIMIFGALLEFRALFPRMRRWATPVLVINSVAILVSMTRSLWLAGLLTLGLHLLWHRSKWAWWLPALPLLAFLIAPAPVRYRVVQSIRPDYYSNSERVQMLRVGWRMLQEQPLVGMGPGRIESLYPHYLAPGEPVPAYHGHLHNNAVQLAAEFGMPVLATAALFVIVLLVDLARLRNQPFLSRAGILSVIGFLAIGMTDYTYGHSLGLILLRFAAITPLMTRNEVVVQKCEQGHQIAYVQS
jgi:O-antigen ligase